MTILFDSVGVGISASGTTATWQHVIGTSATALIVGISFDGTPQSSVTRTVRVGSKTLTSLGFMPSNTFNHWVELFGTLSPPTGVQSVTVTTSVGVSIVGSSVAYRGVASLGSSYTNFFPYVNYSVTQPAAAGNWLVGVMGSAYGIAIVRPAASGVDRQVIGGYPCMAILDAVSTGTSATITLNASSNAAGSGVSVVLVPVAGATGIAQTVNATPLAVTASFAASADTTSVRMGSASLAATATVTASASAMGAREMGTNLPVIASASASALLSAQADADLTVTATRTVQPDGALWIFNSSLAVTSTRTATATVTLAPIPPPVAKSPLRYVGRYPDTEGSVAPRSYAQAANDKTKVTTDFITKTVDGLVFSLATTAYVDQQDNTKALKTAVTAADEAYFPATGHNLAVLDNEGFVAASQIPTGSIVTNRVSGCYVGSAGGGTVSGSGFRALLLGTVSVPDPGFPYVVLPFAWVSGSAAGTGSRWAGAGTSAKLVVMPTSSDAVCGWGVCAASQRPSSYPLTPAVSMGVASQKFTGAITLGLYGSVMTEGAGLSYTFGGGSFYVITLPAV